MGHSIKLDSESLLFVQKLQLEYVGLLGPKKRFRNSKINQLKEKGFKESCTRTGWIKYRRFFAREYSTFSYFTMSRKVLLLK